MPSLGGILRVAENSRSDAGAGCARRIFDLRVAIARPSGCALFAPLLDWRQRSDARSSPRPPPSRMKFCLAQVAGDPIRVSATAATDRT